MASNSELETFKLSNSVAAQTFEVEMRQPLELSSSKLHRTPNFHSLIFFQSRDRNKLEIEFERKSSKLSVRSFESLRHLRVRNFESLKIESDLPSCISITKGQTRNVRTFQLRNLSNCRARMSSNTQSLNFEARRL